jgi:RNA polymerase sigma-70 factor (ECF subfamily)
LSNSDLVQDTCLSAHRDFDAFRGTTEPEFTAWLREIMAHVCANHTRDHRRQRRDVRLERQFYALFNQSSAVLERALANSGTDPGQNLIQRERAVILANALDQLPKDYREVLVGRELEGRSLSEIAAQVGKTPNAVQKIWARALVELRRIMRTSLDSP